MKEPTIKSGLSWPASNMPNSLQDMVQVVIQYCPQLTFSMIKPLVDGNRFCFVPDVEIREDGSREYLTSPEVVTQSGLMYLSWQNSTLPDRLSHLLIQVRMYHPKGDLSEMRPVLDSRSFMIRF